MVIRENVNVDLINIVHCEDLKYGMGVFVLINIIIYAICSLV